MKKTILYHVTVKTRQQPIEWVGRFLEEPTLDNISHAILEDILDVQAEADNEDDETDAEYHSDRASELRLVREVIEVANNYGDIIVGGCKVGMIEMDELQAFTIDGQRKELP